MGSSTTSVQAIADFAANLGELTPVLPTGGFSVQSALTIATDVMGDLIAQRFNWRWNRMILPPWYTISWQLDYAGLNATYPAPIGWLETAWWVDINNTSYPKPSWPIEIKRDIAVTTISGNPPAKLDWDYNRNLQQDVWPGPGKVYTQPLGALITPTNPRTNIRDANNNILVLTTYGTTGLTAPSAAADSPEGTTVNDGSCVWTVASPDSQGFRIFPLPPQQGVVYQINVVAQMKAPPPYTSMTQQINPVPDDHAQYFRSGFVAYCYRNSPNPQMRALFPQQRQLWLASIEASMKQGDREQTDSGFIPDRSVIAGWGIQDVGPAWPYANGWPWPGR
jgi:hypothetical protein